MSSLRSGVKYVAERVIASSSGAALSRRKFRQRVLVLAYHNIVPTGSRQVGDKSLHLPQSAFAEQLDSLLETHDVVPLQDVLLGCGKEDLPHERPRAAITFDDAYEGAVTVGVHELRVRGLPATVFASPGFLAGKSFWWDMLADPATGLNDELRTRVLSEARGLSAEAVDLAGRAGVKRNEVPGYACGVSISDLTAALRYDKLSMAAHTWNHPNLTTLSDSDLVAELARPMEWLNAFGNRALPMISYPYGLADRRVMDASRDAGYTAGFMIDGGWTTPGAVDPFSIPRLNIPAGISRDGFILRTSGLIQGR